MAILLGALILIWLGLAAARACRRTLDVELHAVPALVTPLLLAAAETVLFCAAMTSSELLPDTYRTAIMATVLISVWLVHGGVVGWRAWQFHHADTGFKNCTIR